MQEHSVAADIPTLNWTKLGRKHPLDLNFIHPSPEVLWRASLSAETFSVLPTHAPSVNASYEIKFFGPALECRDANKTQQQLFDLWAESFWRTRHVFTPATYYKFLSQTPDNTKFYPQQLIFSAFSWDYEGLASEHRYNSDTIPNGCTDNKTWIPPTDFPHEQPLQIWVQTASSSESVCTLMNATFDVSFQFRNGIQISTVNSITVHNPVFLPTNILVLWRRSEVPMQSGVVHVVSQS